jgi:hypothetical protein
MFLYTNKAFMTDLGSNFVVHLLLVHMMSLFTDLTGTLKGVAYVEATEAAATEVKNIYKKNI